MSTDEHRRCTLQFPAMVESMCPLRVLSVGHRELVAGTAFTEPGQRLRRTSPGRSGTTAAIPEKDR